MPQPAEGEASATELSESELFASEHSIQDNQCLGLASNQVIQGGNVMTRQANPMTRGRLKTRHMVLLVHLDEQRSVLRAAKAANMTQPGASKLLNDLEESLGVRLFKRHARGIEPTQYGEIMTRHARSALAEMDRAQDELAALRSGLAGFLVMRNSSILPMQGSLDFPDSASATVRSLLGFFPS